MSTNHRPSDSLSTEFMENVIDLYGEDVLKIASLYLRDRQSAEDAFQEVFLRVYERSHQFRHEAHMKTWIIRITINLCKDILKKPWYRRILLTDEVKHPNNDYPTDLKLIQNERDRFLFNEIMGLPQGYRDIIILKYYRDYDNSEIAKILGITQSSVRSKLTRARKKLKSKLDREDYIYEQSGYI